MKDQSISCRVSDSLFVSDVQQHQQKVSSEANTSCFKPTNWWQRTLRDRIIRLLSGALAENTIIIQDSDGEHRIGKSSNSTCQATMIVNDPHVYSYLCWQGSLGAAEAYLRGYWTTSDLLQFLRIFTRQCESICSLDTGLASFYSAAARFLAVRRRNTRSGSQRNIADHYDLSNEFFALFLDSEMMYSSACYFAPDMTLEQASQAKLNHLCRKLRLEPSDHLLEIGTGWGGLASFAASTFGCKVSTTTISQKQHNYAKTLFHSKGLSDRINLLQKDYRDLEGKYDKVVSVEMIEAVGRQYLNEYFRCCNDLLKPGGRLVIQAIVIPEQRYDIYCKSVDFIQAYIFPGSFLPSIASMQQAVGQGTSLRLVGIEDFTPSYARTLHSWRERFHNKLDAVRSLGFDERFIRMWDFYLCSCEAVFHERAAGLVQLEWIKT